MTFLIYLMGLFFDNDSNNNDNAQYAIVSEAPSQNANGWITFSVLQVFPVLWVFNATLHFPCTRKLYFGNVYIQKGTK